MATVSPLRRSAYARRIPTPGDLQGFRRSIARETRRRRRRMWSMPRMIASVLLLLMIAPVAGAFAGAGAGYERATTGCQIVSIVDSNTVTLACPGQPAVAHDIMGLAAPSLFHPSCLSEAWYGLRAEIALRSHVWRAQELTFITEPRGRLVLVFADGVPLHRLIEPAPAHPCA